VIGSGPKVTLMILPIASFHNLHRIVSIVTIAFA
jgi:hypothetical protein